MDDSAVFAVRAKYADDLEELVQCPVCFERPSGLVPTCRQGHHLCSRCRDSVLECPVCRSGFGDARNFVVEELSSKLKDILSSLLEPNPIPALLLQPPPPPPPPRKVTKSASTQTDAPAPSHPDESVVIVDEYLLRGCRIGFCQAQLPAECVYFHVRDCHRANLITADVVSSDDSYNDSSVSAIGCSFSHRWSLTYDLDKLLDYAVYAEELGLFFFSVHIDHEGNLQLELHIADSYQDDELEYEIDVYVPKRRQNVVFNGKVKTCLASAKKFANARKCGKDVFQYFFESDGKTLNKQRTLPITIGLDVDRIERRSARSSDFFKSVNV